MLAGRLTSQVLLAAALAGVGAVEHEVLLTGPLGAFLPLAQAPSSLPAALSAEIEVPVGAPADLGVGAWASDRDGNWWQWNRPGVLGPGRHRVLLPLAGSARPHGHAAPAGPEAAHAQQAGLLFWTAQPLPVRLRVLDLAPADLAPAPAPARLLDLTWTGATARNDGNLAVTTGQRLALRLRPVPAPANPYDPDEFALEARIERPDGRVETVGGFWREPVELADDAAETPLASGPGHMELRWRARVPGAHRLILTGRWRDGRTASASLALSASGAVWDPYLRVDAGDRRYLADGHGRFAWPVGLNLHSFGDQRAAEFLGSTPEPRRPWAGYRRRLERLAAAGGDLTEIWLSSWNLALEWRADWPGYRGLGRYAPGNAERLDRILDLAEDLGIRVVLTLRNHGMASIRSDPEWHSNPANAALGGPLPANDAASYLVNPDIRPYQERLHRYLIARYGDNPTILTWKLWSEMNLTSAKREDRRTWCAWAADGIRRLDPWQHPVSTHWSLDYRAVDAVLVNSETLDLFCYNAYHTRTDGVGNLMELLWSSLHDPSRGHGRAGRPGLITEFGGSWEAGPAPQLTAEHAAAPWAAVVCGMPSGPLLWWHEWVDQQNAYGSYAAVRRFLAGEDLRQSRPIELACDRPELWCRALVRSGWLLGVAVQRDWGASDQAPPAQPAVITVGQAIPAGPLRLTWWDARRGVALATQDIDHPGGPLLLRSPPFSDLIAWKLVRRSSP